MNSIIFAVFFVIINEISRLGILCQDIPRLSPFVFPSDLTIGSRARVLCGAYLGDQPLDFHWQKNGRNLSSVKIQQLDPFTSELVLEPLSLEHIGNYTCIVTNSFGSDRVTAPLLVKAPPQWIMEPMDSKVRIGETVALNCMANGSPTVKITWKRRSASLGDLIPVIPSQSFQILPNDSLVILHAQKSEDGVYVCEASNGIGDVLRKSAQITVYEHPVVKRTVDHVTVERGRTAFLSCLATGNDPLSLTWTKNKKPLSDWPEMLDRLSFSENPGSAGIKFTLTISATELEDEGVYTCKGKNEFGSDEKDVRLLLVERPHPPEYIEVVDIWSRSVRIRWTAPSNGNSPILSYSVEYWSNSGGQQNETISSSTSTSILRGLSPFTLYQFRIWAVNSVGMSDPSEQEQFTTAKEEPSAPPMDVAITETGSTFVRLSWKAPPHQDWNGGLVGFYVGYKQGSSKQPFTFNTVDFDDDTVHYVLRGLRKATRYLVAIKSYNEIGSGPSSQEMSFRTHNQEPPPRPTLMIKSIGSTYLQLQWFLVDETKVSVTSYTLYYRKNKDKWHEITVPDVAQTTFTLTNLDVDHIYQVFITSHSNLGMSEPSEIATVRTIAEPIIQSGAAAPPPIQAAVDDVTQTLYIVIPVAVATVIIVIVIVGACVYVYSKRPLPMPLTYGDIPPDKNFCYMATAPRRRDPGLPVCGSDLMKQGSPYSTTPLTRSDHEDDEPIYESVMDEIRCKIKQRAFEDEKKIGTGTIV